MRESVEEIVASGPKSYTDENDTTSMLVMMMVGAEMVERLVRKGEPLNERGRAALSELSSRIAAIRGML